MRTNKIQLAQIYKLRVKAWEQYGHITKEIYPNGYFDDLDKDALHWTIAINKKIIASARLNILDNLNQLPYPGTFKRVLAAQSDCLFAFYSRLVVDPDFQGHDMSKILDMERVKYIKSRPEIKFAIATAGLRRAKKLEQYGFETIGRVVSSDDYSSMDNFETLIIKMENE